VQPLAERLAEDFSALHPGVEIDVQGGGSSVGVESAGQGRVDVGMASRELRESELAAYPDLQVFTIARDAIAIIVHPNVPVDNLTVSQVRDIFAGEITNWQDVGGHDAPIIVVSRQEGSGTRAAFEYLVMGSDGPPITDKALVLACSGGGCHPVTTVSTTPGSIGYIAFGYLDRPVKPLAIDGVAPTLANMVTDRYPIMRPLNLLTRGAPTGVTKEWLDFILGEQGQAIVVEHYLPGEPR
jgi:phosphate transport system substrate-binding protein